jgi:hypothetical protein
MCVVSMVHDHYFDRFKPYVQPQETKWPWPAEPPVDTDELRKLIDEFKEAIAAAKKIDVLTKQPDCVDPEKAKLSARVAELEKKLADIAKAATGK